jgi:hypothetical protein
VPGFNPVHFRYPSHCHLTKIIEPWTPGNMKFTFPLKGVDYNKQKLFEGIKKPSIKNVDTIYPPIVVNLKT